MTALAADTVTKLRVLIAADHLPTRTGMRLALEEHAVCTEAEDAESAVAAAVRERPDVCVLDFDAPARAIRTAAEITARVPGAIVVMLTSRLDEDECLAAVRAGATGYLPEGIDPARLPHVVRAVLRGEVAVPRAFVARMIDELRGRERRRRHLDLRERRRVELTAREWEVVELLRQRLSTHEIAVRLGISQVTVRRHLSGVLQKVGVATRDEVLRLLEDDER